MFIASVILMLIGVKLLSDTNAGIGRGVAIIVCFELSSILAWLA